MDGCLVCKSVTATNWWWFAVATIISFGIGGVWYSWLFAKAWVKVFKVEMEEFSTASIVGTMSFQFVATLLFGLIFFILTNLSVGVAILTLFGFCGWQASMLKFQFGRTKDFFMALAVRVGYTFVAGIVFILFALL